MTKPFGGDSTYAMVGLAQPDEPQTEIIEATSHHLSGRVEHAGNGAQVVTANGQHPAVEVLTLHLDHSQIATE
jgi:hypothetical protein